jgi:flagellar hook-length control protein FliK
MNHITINAAPVKVTATGAAGATGTTATTGDPIDADIFRVALATQVGALTPTVSPKTGKPTATAAAASSAQTALEAKIKKLIESGASHTEIVSALAANLAAGVSQALDITSADARAQLQTVFATALAPPGESPGSPTDTAQLLAKRAVQLQNLAESILSSNQSGQQKRIAGNLLDAQRAKDIPAQTTRTTFSASDVVMANASHASGSVTPSTDALSGGKTPSHAAEATLVTAAAATARVNAAASAASTATLPSALTVAANVVAGLPVKTNVSASISGAADGKTVKLGTTAAIAAGGDTTLGRVLSRAALAADARDAQNSAAQSQTNSDTNTNTTRENAATAGRPANAATAAAPATAAAQPATLTGGSPDPKIAAFLKSFTAALSEDSNAINAASTAQRDAQALVAAPAVAAHAPAAPSPAFMPSVAPFAIEHVGATVATAPTPAAAPTDQSAIVDQVLRGALLRTTGGSSEIRLSLVPESLGDVSVKLVVDAGNVSAHVVAQTSEVRDALVSAQPQLTKSLADAGLKLTSFTVDMSGGGSASFAQQQHDQAQSGKRQRYTIGSIASDEDSDESAVDAVPMFGPPSPAGARPGDYNYLV